MYKHLSQIIDALVAKGWRILDYEISTLDVLPDGGFSGGWQMTIISPGGARGTVSGRDVATVLTQIERLPGAEMDVADATPA